jgi:hypothetical protein
LAKTQNDLEQETVGASPEKMSVLEGRDKRETARLEKMIQASLSLSQKAVLKKLTEASGQPGLQIEARFLHLIGTPRTLLHSEEFGGNTPKGKEHITVKKD